jgi:hypothetical protein
VTYGSISSGIALEEAGKLLNSSGRMVIAGMKLASSHKMTRAFMEKEFSADISQDPMLAAVKGLVDRIASFRFAYRPVNVTGSFFYNGFVLKKLYNFQVILKRDVNS